MTTGLPLRVLAMGRYEPPEVETADDLAPRLGRSAHWIRSRTGVAERRISRIDVAEMAAIAARDALGDGPPPDLVINCGLSPAQLIPDTSAFVSRAMGWSGIPGFSVHATCLGFLVGLHTAAAFLHAGAYRRILLVAAERGTQCRDLDDPESGALIGDGAAAAVVAADPDGTSALLGYALTTLPEGADLARIRGFGSRHPPDHPDTRPAHHRFQMNGPRIYRLARKAVGPVIERALHEAGVTRDDITLVVPHQASGPALAALPRLGFSADRVVNVVARFGNCISASIPMALSIAESEGRLKRGQLVLLVGTGAGLSVGAAVLRW